MLNGSYMSRGLELAVAVVNALTPGWRGGKRFDLRGPLRGAALSILPDVVTTVTDITEEESVRLRALADELRHVFELCDRGAVSESSERINALFRRYGVAPELWQDAEGQWHLHFHARRSGVAASWASGAATAMAFWVDQGMTGKLGVCSADRCDRVYADGSKNGSRRFCSEACQARTKVAAHRARQAQGKSAQDPVIRGR
jgi:predicted RNA-binding Zn ribbon-like protein